MKLSRALVVVGGSTALVISGWSTALAAGPPARSAIPTVKLTVRAGDFSFETPARIRTGMVRVKIVNQGGEPHQAQIAKLHAGVTFDQVEAAAKESGNDAGLLSLVDVVGGPNGVEPGATSATIDELAPGSYALICFIRSADGVSHFARGMVAPFTVTKKQGPSRPPRAKAQITMNEFGYALPERLPSRGIVAVKNVGAQDHELGLFLIDPGTTTDEAKQAVIGATSEGEARPVHEAGGIVGLEPGETGYIELALAPGHYAAVCFFPDPTKGNVPHLLEGMFQEFDIE